MTVFFHELKRNRLAFLIWCGAIAFMLTVCVFIYPEMSSEMEEIGDMFADMGAFSEAFGMDQLNFGEFMGYFGVECGNTLGIGGALFAAILGISALAKEQKDGTAEFLLTHPLSRERIVFEKLLAILSQLLVLDVVVAVCCSLSSLIISAEVKWPELLLLFLAHLILQIQIALMTLGLSAFLKGNGLGVGLGRALLLYFLNILANLTEQLEFLKFLTPFSYADGAFIIKECGIEIRYLLPGLLFALAGAAVAFIKYRSKDIT